MLFRQLRLYVCVFLSEHMMVLFPSSTILYALCVLLIQFKEK